MTTLDRVTIVSSVTVLVVAWLMVAVSAWKLRRGRGDAWRRYRRGFLMIAIGVTLGAMRLLFRLPHEFTVVYFTVGGVGLTIVVSGFIVLVRTHRSADRGRSGRRPGR
jgi:L-asparagine transporter-like permease